MSTISFGEGQDDSDLLPSSTYDVENDSDKHTSANKQFDKPTLSDLLLSTEKAFGLSGSCLNYLIHES